MSRNGSRRAGRAARRVAASLTTVGLVALVAAGVLILTRYHSVAIPNPSMAPGLRSGDHVLVDSSQAGSARYGDVVLFKASHWGLVGSPYELKRVLAVGGDQLVCCDAAGGLTRNGRVLVEPYLLADDSTSAPRSFTVTVPPGRMFLLGDNRDDSSDSRDHLTQDLGTVPVSSVVGRVVAVVLPVARAARVSSPDRDEPVPRWLLAAGMTSTGLLALLTAAGIYLRMPRRRSV